MAKFVDNTSCLSRLFIVVSVLCRSFTSLASVFNIVHTFVCGDNAGPSTTNANESIPDGAVNVNVNAHVHFINTPKHLLVVTLLSLLMPFAETKAVVLARFS